MKNYLHLLIVSLIFISCQAQDMPTEFSSAALNDSFVNLQNENIQLKSILEKHKNKTIVIDVWASWCKDCVKGMSKVKGLQADKKDVVFIFLSLDKNIKAWKKGIKKHDVTGEHYFVKSGWKGAFGKFVDLDWIPRYMVVGKDGKIKLFEAIKADDDRITKVLI